jgi:tetraacyldisaccharide 4'-kinase
MRFADRLVAAWHERHLTTLTLSLVPAALVFGALAALRRGCYRAGCLAVVRLPLPVVVVGNIGVGGTGKTPLVAALARDLAARGFRPGVVSRGYGRATAGTAPPILVAPDADANTVGDEPLLLARRGFPVAVARDRVAAARALIAAHPQCDVVIADDGLQHYRLGRAAEVVVVDAARGFGNGWLLPAGPLREPRSRLAGVTAVVWNGGVPGRALAPERGGFSMTLVAGDWRRVDGQAGSLPAGAFAGRRAHAVAGIGNPARFFAQLREHGVDPIEHPFPDHHRFAAGEIAFGDDLPVLMTEKDAVKCLRFADRRCWYLPVEARLDPSLVARIEEKLRGSQAA